MRTVALDLGDRWIGIAISDPLGIVARPYDTVKAGQLTRYLHRLLDAEKISTIVVGHPRTLRGTDSDQTRKAVAQFNQLKELFPTVEWALWDERLTSKQAASYGKKGANEGAESIHARAAALVLTTYLAYRASEPPIAGE